MTLRSSGPASWRHLLYLVIYSYWPASQQLRRVDVSTNESVRQSESHSYQENGLRSVSLAFHPPFHCTLGDPRAMIYQALVTASIHHNKAPKSFAKRKPHSRLNIDGVSGLHMLLMSAWALTISGRNWSIAVTPSNAMPRATSSDKTVQVRSVIISNIKSSPISSSPALTINQLLHAF